MKNKGFTLLELLAVIVILAIISIIAIPMIGNVIEESKKKSLEQSASGLIEAASYYKISHEGVTEFVFDENKKGETIKGDKLEYKGNIEGTGKLYIDKNGDISLCLVDDKYYVYKNYNSGIYVGEVKDNSCIIGYDVLTNKYVAMLDDGSGQISNVYSKDEVNNLIDNVDSKVTTNKNEITNIKSTIETLQSSLNETNTNLNDLSNVVGSHTETIDNLSENVVSNTSAIEVINNDLDNIKNGIFKHKTYILNQSVNGNGSINLLSIPHDLPTNALIISISVRASWSWVLCSVSNFVNTNSAKTVQVLYTTRAVSQVTSTNFTVDIIYQIPN